LNLKIIPRRVAETQSLILCNTATLQEKQVITLVLAFKTSLS
jgi:hypothetical protein